MQLRVSFSSLKSINWIPHLSGSSSYLPVPCRVPQVERGTVKESQSSKDSTLTHRGKGIHDCDGHSVTQRQPAFLL